MPKVNVYLPDELADTVREAGLPVSAICQRALEQSVRRVGAIRAVALGDLGEDPAAGLTHFTERARQVIRLAVAHARERRAPEVGTRDLLHGMIAEGSNLALHVLGVLEVEPARVLREVAGVAARAESGEPERLSATAANACELTVVEALVLGHNYVGCEHLLLGLVAEPDGMGGQVLRGLGVEPKAARQVVSAALAGYVHLRSGQAGDTPAGALASVVGQALEPVLRRLDRLEEAAGLP